MQSNLSRRVVIRLLAAGAAAGVAVANTDSSDDADSVDGASDGTDDSTDGQIPAPFDAIPTLESPSEDDRFVATNRYPDGAVPESGPIPDPHHFAYSSAEVTVPEWAIESARERVNDADELSEYQAEEYFLAYAQPDLTFVTEDGDDAVSTLFERLEEDNDG